MSVQESSGLAGTGPVPASLVVTVQPDPQHSFSPSPSLVLPQVRHDEIVGNRDLFFATLQKFHSVMGTKFMVPIVGGKELDLHRFYVEVTARGGIQQAIKEKKWSQITSIFEFPSASYILRKHYLNLLKEFERVYFLQAQGQLPGDNGITNCGSDDMEQETKKRKAKCFEMPVGVDPTSSVDQPVTGVIDGKFEHGYLVTVRLGADILTGVLYHVPPGGSSVQHAGISCFQSTSSFDAAASEMNGSRKKRKDRVRRRAPDHPKPNRSGYNFFFAEQHARLKALHPNRDRELSKMIGELWNKLNEEERAVYQNIGLKDKERYKKEMEEYKQRLKDGSHPCEVLNQQPEGTQNSNDQRSEQQLPTGAEQNVAEMNMACQPTKTCTAEDNVSTEQIFSNQDNACQKPFSEQGTYG